MSNLIEQAKSWLHDEILPWWAEHGWDSEFGGFHEAFDADLNPVIDRGKRVMVQARQVVVFSSFKKYQGLAEAGWDWMDKHYFDCGDGLWRAWADRDGTPDGRSIEPDQYAQAFAILAMAKMGNRERQANVTANALAALPPVHEQDTWMHYVEACLAYTAKGQDRYCGFKQDAHDYLEFCCDRFVVDGFLREYFTEDWQPDPERGNIVRPGHHFEWIWLVYEYTRLTGDRSFLPIARGELFRNGYIGAVTDGRPLGAIPYEIRLTKAWGPRVTDDRFRLWPQCECLRANVARYCEFGGNAARDRAEQTLRLILQYFRKGPIWHEWLNADGAPIGNGEVPASSLYHLVGALSAAIEILED